MWKKEQRTKRNKYKYLKTLLKCVFMLYNLTSELKRERDKERKKERKKEGRKGERERERKWKKNFNLIIESIF